MARPVVPALIQFGTTINAGSEIGQFGSYASPIYSNNLSTIMNGTAWPRGWFGSVASNQRQFIQDQNAMDFVAQAYLFYIMTLGVVEYIAAMTYWTNSIIQVAGQFFISLVDNNVGNTPSTSPTQWQSGIPGMEVTGVIKAYAGLVAPNGYLLCNGQAVSRTTYAALFTVCGTNYGAGNGTTTFNVPNLQGQIPVAYLSGDTYFGTVGQTGGEEEHTLLISEIPSHTHGVSDSVSCAQGPGFNWRVNPSNGIASTAVGGGLPHNNVQPYQCVGSYIIKS